MDCKAKKFTTCPASCQTSSLGVDDRCSGSDQTPGQQSAFTVIADVDAAKVESEALGTTVDAAWVRSDLNNLCSSTLKVNGNPINTCRSGFKAGAFNGRFDDAKVAGSPTAKWLIDCTGASEPRWLLCRNSCVKAAYGSMDSCR